MKTALRHIADALRGHYAPEEARNFARLILKDVCGWSFADIAACKFNNLSDAEAQKIEDIVARLANYEPYQYILGQTEFFGLPFRVTPAVLIPRPETEELVEWIVSENALPEPRVLDIGTGSGCIAVALAKNMPRAAVCAWDVSETALQVASQNAELNGAPVLFEQKDVLLPAEETRRFDIIVSNPPYIAQSEKAEMNANVLDFEPHTALFVPDDNPLLFYRRIADIARQCLARGGKLYFEINREKGGEICAMLSEKGFADVELRKDISGNERMIRAKKE